MVTRPSCHHSVAQQLTSRNNLQCRAPVNREAPGLFFADRSWWGFSLSPGVAGAPAEIGTCTFRGHRRPACLPIFREWPDPTSVDSQGYPADSTCTRLSENVGAFPRSASLSALMELTVLLERLSLRQ